MGVHAWSNEQCPRHSAVWHWSWRVALWLDGKTIWPAAESWVGWAIAIYWLTWTLPTFLRPVTNFPHNLVNSLIFSSTHLIMFSFKLGMEYLNNTNLIYILLWNPGENLYRSPSCGSQLWPRPSWPSTRCAATPGDIGCVSTVSGERSWDVGQACLNLMENWDHEK